MNKLTENYNSYITRIHNLIENRGCLPPAWECFATSQGLNRKVTMDGAFRPFYGDTTLFYLPEEVKQSLESIQASLYAAAGHMLSQELPVNTFHITLHDLCSSETQMETAGPCEYHRSRMTRLLPELSNNGMLHLRAAGLVSMVASSVVMLFEPSGQADHDLIQEMYGRIDELFPLSYPLTLHCTLAYYKPGVYEPEQWKPLERLILSVNSGNMSRIEFELDSAALEYQLFFSMKDYGDRYNAIL